MLRKLLIPLLSIFLATSVFGQTANTASSADTKDGQSSSGDDDQFFALLSVLSQTPDEHGKAQSQLSYSMRALEIYDSNPQGTIRRIQSDGISSFGGSFGLTQSWNHASLTANYNGGGDYHLNFSKLNQSYHEFNGAQSFRFGRANLLFGGDYEFLPASSFGFDAIHQVPTASYDLINSDLVPNQSIQTRPLNRMSYTGVSQLGLQLTDRSALHFSGSYGRLRYENNGIPGTNQASAGAGYTFAITSRDSVAFSYQYLLFETSHNPLQIVDHVVEASYGHRIGQKFLIKVGAGPDLRMYNGTKSKSLRGVDTSLAATAQLAYNPSKATSMNTAYSRSTSGGAGVLQGSQSDQIQFSLSQSFAHGWSASASTGYARSTSLARVARTRKLVDQIFNSDFFSVGISRSIGHNVAMNFGYTLQGQNSTAPVCVGGLCQDFPLHHVITFGISFSPQPIKLK